MSITVEKITADDALFVIQKSARDEKLEVANKPENTGFEYATSEEALVVSTKASELFRPTLDELKYR